MIGAPAWLFGNVPQVSFQAPFQPGAQLRAAGGRAAGMSPDMFDPTQLAIGTRVELEHTSDPYIARKIAMDHLVEDPMYYQKLAQVHLDGLGITRARWAEPAQGLSGLGITRARWTQPPGFATSEQQLAGMLDFFDSPLWKYRKVLILGGVGLIGVGLLGFIGAVLK